MKSYFKKLKYYHYVRFILYLVIAVLLFLHPILFSIILLLSLIISLMVVSISNNKMVRRISGNSIIYGGRGKGKGILLNYKIKKDKTKPFVNVPYFETLDRERGVIIDGLTLKETPYKDGDYYHTELLKDITVYFNSIKPLTVEDFINGIDKTVEKNNIFEGRNVYIDDVNVYMPNWADSLLKKKYDSMPPFLAINRHLYNAYCVITTQDRERPYKILKELQTDGSIKAIKTYGFGDFWNMIPFLHFFVYTKYIYHELPKSVDMLPFNSKSIITESLKHGFLTSGQAIKEQYQATNGIISYGFTLQLKKNISFYTRYFHKIVYGVLPE